MIIREFNDYEQVVELEKTFYKVTVGGAVKKFTDTKYKGVLSRKHISEDEALDMFYKYMPEYWDMFSRDFHLQYGDDSGFLKLLESFRFEKATMSAYDSQFTAEYSVSLETVKPIDTYDIQKLFNRWKFKNIKETQNGIHYYFGIIYVDIDEQ